MAMRYIYYFLCKFFLLTWFALVKSNRDPFNFYCDLDQILTVETVGNNQVKIKCGLPLICGKLVVGDYKLTDTCTGELEFSSGVDYDGFGYVKNRPVEFAAPGDYVATNCHTVSVSDGAASQNLKPAAAASPISAGGGGGGSGSVAVADFDNYACSRPAPTSSQFVKNVIKRAGGIDILVCSIQCRTTTTKQPTTVKTQHSDGDSSGSSSVNSNGGVVGGWSTWESWTDGTTGNTADDVNRDSSGSELVDCDDSGNEIKDKNKVKDKSNNGGEGKHLGQIKQAEGTIKGKREAEIPDKAHTNNGHQPDTHSNNGKKPEDKGNNGHHVNHGKKCREGKHKGQQPQGEISDASAASASAAASAKDIVKIDNGNNGNSGNNGNKGNSGNNGNNGDNGDNGNNGNNGNSGNNGKSSDNSNNQNKGQEGKTGKGSAEKNGQTSQKSQQNKQQKNEEHHRAEPQPASAQTIQSGSGLAALAVPKCFSGDMEIQTKQGVKLMNKLEVGDNVLTASTIANKPEYQPIAMFIHRKSDLITEFLQIRTSSNFTLKLSEDHLIPIVLCSQEMSLSLLSNGERFVSVNSQPAKLAEPGLCVVSLINDQFVLDAIVAVDKVRAKGIFAPITKSGNILVNGMLTSCYSGYDNNGFQRTIFNFVSKISSWWLGTSYINVGNEDLEIPTILQVFLQITELFDFKY